MRKFAFLAASLIAVAAPSWAARPVQFATTAPTDGALVLPLGSAADLALRGAMLSSADRSAVARALTSSDFKYEENDTLTLRGIGPWSQILIVGTGSDTLEPIDLQDIGGTAARATASENGPVALAATGLGADAAAQIALGTRLGSYSFDRYKSRDAENPPPAGRDAPMTILTRDARAAETSWSRQAEALAQSIFFARDISTEPANVIYPESFVERAREAFAGVADVTIEVMDEAELTRRGMGGILSVGQGSSRPPRLMIVQYRGPGSADRPIVLAGKGITFDSGGISLKPGTNMWQMKNDMAGAGAVTATVLNLARSRAPVNVVAVAALAENMPDGAAARPGDVIRAYNGKTIERINTDAEGRIVLADAVSYAEERFNPLAIVDVATLTGAIVGALGSEYAGLFSRHDALAEQLTEAGEATGELLWRMPLHPDYGEALSSPIADMREVTTSAPGAGAGAHFIGSFVSPETPWAHLDIAGVDWADSDSPTVPKGATSFSVRLLDRFVRNFQPVPATND